jgi:predicted AAA+ superfamily ATPase
MNMVSRSFCCQRLERALGRNPVVALIGPRQCGKSTLARGLATGQQAAYFDLEDPRDLARLRNPMLEMEHREGLVILDEIQRLPELLPVLRVLADREPLPARFLLLGSATPDLVRASSETLAGRIEFVEMSGFSLDEVGEGSQAELWERGGFPRSFLARGSAYSLAWREQFVRTFLERDIPQLGITIPAQALHRFWTMLAHYHGQTWNGAEIGRSLGLAHTTVRRYLDLLCGTFVVRQLPPWFENAGKRTVKAPKVYIRDSGVLHALLRLPDRDAIAGHPKAGASWEGFALEEVLRWVGDRDAYFWGTHGGAELDLFLLHQGRRLGIEFKYADAPVLTRSMKVALHDLRLDRLLVVHPGASGWRLDERSEVVPLPQLRGVLGLGGGVLA